MSLDWHHNTVGRYVWTADGVYAKQWYAVVRRWEKLWLAVFHDEDAEGLIEQTLGKGDFNTARRLCAEHAQRVKELG